MGTGKGTITDPDGNFFAEVTVSLDGTSMGSALSWDPPVPLAAGFTLSYKVEFPPGAGPISAFGTMYGDRWPGSPTPDIAMRARGLNRQLRSTGEDGRHPSRP